MAGATGRLGFGLASLGDYEVMPVTKEIKELIVRVTVG
jgi:hypothetical protein